MIVLDASIVNIALPSAEKALSISTGNRQWVITAYTLSFGGLLLLGGRIADYVGRKKIFVIGLLGFAASSALGGFAINGPMLFAARALQGGFGAIMAPAALSLITVTFTEPKERATAFGVYGGIAGGGAAIGLIVGGVLTEYASWRWCLFVNTPVAILTAIAAILIVKESKAEGNTKYDVPGAVLATLGLVSLVYGFTVASTNGWGSTSTILYVFTALVLLAGFFYYESKVSTNPLLPMRIILDKNRGASYLVSLAAGIGMFGAFLFLTFYFQGVLNYSALKAGFAFLPFSAGIILAAGAASKILPRTGPRPLMALGFLAGSGGLLWMSQIGLHTDFFIHVMPSEIVMSVGMGFAFVSLSSTALVGVSPHDAGVASATLNTSQQIGGTLGTALLNTIAATATRNYIGKNFTNQTVVLNGTIHGFSVGFLVGAFCMLIASIISVVMISDPHKDTSSRVSSSEVLLAPTA
ncbi:MAG: MFS transporter [Acidimicrobiales bacterium]|nr:MFS transporter [Acidimicrobiales bacterium]